MAKPVHACSSATPTSANSVTDIIFGDEPTRAIDSKSTEGIMSILAEINKRGTTVMLVTHDVKVAAKTERVLYMVDGNLVAQKKMRKYDAQPDDIRKREESIKKWILIFHWNLHKVHTLSYEKWLSALFASCEVVSK